MKESPLFVKTYDFLLWLIPRVQKFPKAHRFALSERIQRLALDFQDSLVAAGKAQGAARLERLQQADLQLAQLRVWIRMARDMQAISIRRYERLQLFSIERLSIGCRRLSNRRVMCPKPFPAARGMMQPFFPMPVCRRV